MRTTIRTSVVVPRWVTLRLTSVRLLVGRTDLLVLNFQTFVSNLQVKMHVSARIPHEPIKDGGVSVTYRKAI